ncbi:MAG TPA: hypothetical protein VFE62_07620, partial [Gemmataceae bacterium]|nr:hypothetical protein [Gemmataceae bacterium]
DPASWLLALRRWLKLPRLGPGAIPRSCFTWRQAPTRHPRGHKKYPADEADRGRHLGFARHEGLAGGPGMNTTLTLRQVPWDPFRYAAGLDDQETENKQMEWFTCEITIKSEKGPWTIDQRDAALSAIRVGLQSFRGEVPDEAEVARLLEDALEFAKKYRPSCQGAAMPFEYRPGWGHDPSPEDFEEMAAKMRSQCAAAGLVVTTEHYR